VTASRVIDLFAGPGGWSDGLLLIGLDDLGIELDLTTCKTRRAAGHATIRADVARLPLDPFAGRVEGLIGSPPCPLFSAAGSGLGRKLMAELAAAITDALAGRPTLGRWRRIMARQLRADTLTQSRYRWWTRRDAARFAWETATEATLTAQPARWIAALRPRWVALEQVPPVLDLWRVYARQLKAMGYWTWAGILNAADYGVPQTRRRAFLLASLDRPVEPPAPTHAQGGAETLFGSLAPWVSMAEALGWGLPGDPSPIVMTARNRQTGADALNGSSWRRDWFDRQQEAGNWVARQLRGAGMVDRLGGRPDRPVTEPAPTVRANGGSNASPGFVFVRTGANSMVTGRTGSRAGDGDVQPYERDITEPAPTVDGKVGSAWRLVAGKRALPGDRSIPRTLDQPAPTMGFGHDAAGWAFELHTQRDQRPDGSRQVVSDDRPAPSLTAKSGGQWVFDRPATTIAGDPRCWPPGHKVNEDDRRRRPDADERYGDRAGTEAVRLDISDALILQSFRPDYPVQGTKTAQFAQVGNAVPPRLAAHVLAAVTGRALDLGTAA